MLDVEGDSVLPVLTAVVLDGLMLLAVMLWSGWHAEAAVVVAG